MSVDASNYYLDYLDELIDDRDTTCLHLIVKKSIDTKYLDFMKKLNQIIGFLNLVSLVKDY